MRSTLHYCILQTPHASGLCAPWACRRTVGSTSSSGLPSARSRGLEHIVDQFLAYVQGDIGMRRDDMVPARELLERIVGRAAGAGLDVTLETDGTELLVPGTAFARIVDNLVGNALAFGRTPVVVRFETTPGGVELSVADHGSGMSVEDFERARQPFVRLRAGG